MSTPDRYRVGDPQSFCGRRSRDRWLEQNDPEGVAFEYEVQE
jgi:hypothetical protein